MGKTRRRGRRDNNHKEIIDAIRPIAPVRDLADAGAGVPDIIVWVNGGWQLADIKNLNTKYGRDGLNPTQKNWASQPGGPVYLIHNIDEGIQLARGQFDGLQVFPARNGKMSVADLKALQKRDGATPRGSP